MINIQTGETVPLTEDQKKPVEVWNVWVQLGNWRGAVQLPKALIPDAYEANKKVLDLAMDWVKENE